MWYPDTYPTGHLPDYLYEQKSVETTELHFILCHPHSLELFEHLTERHGELNSPQLFCCK